jgi:hypothetical protein
MKTPEIVKLSSSERKGLMAEIEKGELQADSKKIISDTLDFVDSLIEELKTSKVSIHNLKQLLGFKSEQLKKVVQGR